MTPDPYHHGVIARAIDTIGTTVGDQPTLEELADAVGLSPTHFQKVFSQWVGVSPKRYQQYLTLDHAKRMLENRFTLLETAEGTGLSGTSRLHDLFLRWEAMTPGDYARGGRDLVIRWAWVDSPFGDALVMATDRGICGLAFCAETGRASAMADMRGRWPNASYVEDADTIRPRAAALMTGTGTADLHLIGAPFQIKVWEALLQIPSGAVTTYSEIAGAIGHPRAARAVGTAVGRNPISYLIPCHRALRKSGALGGYHWGLGVKRAMLAWEAARADA
ncbi:MAG: bifunctional helix-turn-helix domain-containing protein/methylated-DNA--[protein]-cysteine S-methyltransferase [Pseudomonadota bacterium]